MPASSGERALGSHDKVEIAIAQKWLLYEP
jgi:hypothetical protein